MTDPINTQNRLRNGAINTQGKPGEAANTDRQGEDTRASARAESAIVELSNPRLLEELGEQIRNLPEVNQARVEAVKTALGNGEYEPDVEVIARKYAEIEKLLP